MRNRLTALLCLWLTTCHAVRPTPADERTPISANPAHAPLPPPATNTTVWDPEPPAVTAALKLRGEAPQQALAALLAEAERAKTAGDQRARAIALHRAADLHLDLGQCEAGEGRYLEALQLHRERKDQRLIATAANDLGLMCSACDRYPVRWFREALEVREAIGEPKGLRLAVHNLGGALMLWRKPAEARPVLERGLELARALQDLEAQRRSHINLASCLAMQADADHLAPWNHEPTGLRAEAHAHLDQAIALATQLGLEPSETCSGLVVDTWYLCNER